MSNREALLASVLAAPDDDAPRGIFADWLDEHDEGERAEFIRIQVAIANGFDESKVPLLQRHRDGSACGCRKCNLHMRQRELLGAPFETKWLKDWPFKRTMIFGDFGGERAAAEINRRQPKWEWHRGFIESITCTMADAAQHLAAIVKEHPIRRVEFVDRGSHVQYFPMSGGDAFAGSRWPGIEFVLPPEPYLSPPEFQRIIRERFAEGMAVITDAAYSSPIHLHPNQAAFFAGRRPV
jgi:uncharacterized protein (TIGR02996 family)